jgi:antirestriction protein ArdC
MEMNTDTTTLTPEFFREDSPPAATPTKMDGAPERNGSIYERVTGRILSQLEAGRIPWRETWACGLPKSLGSGKEYRGVNILLLGCAGYSSRYWVTYREALRLGGHVRKGEKATPVVYWKWRTEEDLQKLRAKTGKEAFAPCVPFVSAVFNLDQVEQVTRPNDDVAQTPDRPLEIAAGVFDVMPDKPEIKHATTDQPCYMPAADQVLMPHLSQFKSADAYYAVLYHELTHSTGHPKRLHRFDDSQSGQIEKYSFEELVAEFGSAFLCGFAGIANPETDSLQVGYIQGWMKALQDDSRLVLKAASAAQRAADYIRGKIVPED